MFDIVNVLHQHTRHNSLQKSQGFGTKEEEEEDIFLRIEKLAKKVRINRKSHSYFARALY